MKVLIAAFLVVGALQEALVDAAISWKPKRYQIGSLMVSNEKGGMLEYVKVSDYEKMGAVKDKMRTKNLMVGIDPMRYRVTMTTIPIPGGWNTSDYSHLVRSRSCVRAKFMTIEDLAIKDNIPEGALIIIANELNAKLLSGAIPFLREKNCKVGLLKRFGALEDKCRKGLVSNGIKFIENLELPSDIDLLSAVKSSKHYYVFKHVFAPFKNGTMTYHSGEYLEPKSLVNLADMVMFEDDVDGKLSRYCEKMGDKVVQFRHKLLSDSFPALPDIEMPHFVKRGGVESEEYWLRFSGQSGTHIVAPYRFDKTKSNIENLNDNFFFAPCVCISSAFGDTVNYRVTKSHLEQWERDKNVRIPENSVILINTNYWKLWDSSPGKYVREYPGIDLDAAKWLVEERKVVGIGMDSLSLDDYSLSNPSSNKWPVHGYLAEKNIPAMLNLRFEGVKDFPEVGSRCVFSYLRIQRGTTSPISIFGLPGYDKFETVEKVEEKKVGVKKVVESKIEEERKFGVGKVMEVEKLGEPGQHWQFGNVISHQTDDCDCNLRQFGYNVLKSGTEQARMFYTETTLTVDPSINKVTTLTQPAKRPVVMTKGCIETLFIKTTDLKSIKKRLFEVKENMLVIFLTADLMKLHDLDLIKEASLKKLTLGFFEDVELPAIIRNKLLENNLTLFENLAYPGEDFHKDQIDEDKIYYGFKYVFAPMSEETSMKQSLDKMEPKRKINLADLVVYDSSDKVIADRCKKALVVSLSYDLSPKIPIAPNISRPVFSEHGKKMSFYDHFGTHLVVPAHFGISSEDTMDVTELPESLDRPVCLKVDIPYGGQKDFTITKKLLVDWENSTGFRIPQGSMVFLITGFGVKNWEKSRDYLINYPGLSLEGAQWLVEERNVSAIGIDSLFLDDYTLTSAMKFPTNLYLANKNVVMIENIGGSDLGRVTSDGQSVCTMAYLRVEDGGGAPAAIYALIPEKPMGPKQPVPSEEPEKAQAPIGSKLSFFGQFLTIVVALGLYLQ